jgi:hypothetical protein
LYVYLFIAAGRASEDEREQQLNLTGIWFANMVNTAGTTRSTTTTRTRPPKSITNFRRQSWDSTNVPVDGPEIAAKATSQLYMFPRVEESNGRVEPIFHCKVDSFCLLSMIRPNRCCEAAVS